MFDYKGISCPVCDEKFGENDDIVVCPDCGAPQHRSCWNENNACAFSQMHSDNFEWKSPNSAPENSAEEQALCQRCGSYNPKEKAFCGDCGSPLGAPAQQQNPYQQQGPYQQNPAYQPPAFGDPLGGVHPDELIDGVTAQTLGKFIGAKSAYFVRLFYFMARRALKVSFNFFAFLFTGIWFLSKKMYKIGVVLCVAMFTLTTANLTLQYIYYQPILDKLSDTATMSEIAAEVMAAPPPAFATLLLMIIPMIQFFIMIYSGAMANNLYKNHCIKQINAIGYDFDANQALYSQKGGTNMAMAIGIYIIYYLFKTYFITIIERFF